MGWLTHRSVPWKGVCGQFIEVVKSCDDVVVVFFVVVVGCQLWLWWCSVWCLVVVMAVLRVNVMQ